MMFGYGYYWAHPLFGWLTTAVKRRLTIRVAVLRRIYERERLDDAAHLIGVVEAQIITTPRAPAWETAVAIKSRTIGKSVGPASHRARGLEPSSRTDGCEPWSQPFRALVRGRSGSIPDGRAHIDRVTTPPMLHIILSLIVLISGADARASRIRANARDLPDVAPGLIDAAVDAALTVETIAVPAEILISIAWGESRFEPAQRTGVVCGALQVNPADIGEPRSSCALWARDQRAGFAAGVKELEIMLADRRVRGDIRRALLYRACGNAAFDGTCTKGRWPGWVLERAAAIRGQRAHRRGAS